MTRAGVYGFSVWKRKVLENLCTLITPEVTAKDFPTVDFRRIYNTVPDPEKAAEIVRAVHIFTKDEYKDPENRKALVLSPSKA